MKKINNLLAIMLAGFAIVGCSENSEKKLADFANVTFSTKQKTLESNGFLCKDELTENKKSITCISHDRSIELLGRAVVERIVKFDQKGTIFSITAKLQPKYASLKERLSLESDLSDVYKKASEIIEVDTRELGLKHWKRPDGSVIRLTIIKGLPGLIDDSVLLAAFSDAQ